MQVAAPVCDYSVGLLSTDDVTVMSAVTEFFATRLVRKESRSARPLDDTTSPLYHCIDEFRALVRHAHGLSVQGESLDTDKWEQDCGAFTEKWKEVCHWCCPVRLGEFLGKHFVIRWSGEEKERKKPPTRSKDRKDAAGKAPAQPFWCPHCGVLCNSLAQTIVHMQGQRHRDQVTLRAAQCAAAGISFNNQPPQPVPPSGTPQQAPLPQAEALPLPPGTLLPMGMPLARAWGVPPAASHSGRGWEEGSCGLSDNTSESVGEEHDDDGPPPLLLE
eukprot:Hpha_TRINITY_DN15867_c0_g4::TRINITY_DN15867_c0_g4_i1::g.188804::m.188804